MEPDLSLLAGYDVVVEFSNELMRELVIASLQLSGINDTPPFEASVPINSGREDGTTGMFYLNVSDVQVDLQTTRPMTIQLCFERAWADTPAGAIGPLNGAIEIPVYFPNVLTKEKQAFISLDLSGIEFWRIAFSSDSKERAESQLQSSGLSYSYFEAVWQEALAQFIQRQPLLLIPTGFIVTEKEGGLSPLRFYEIEAHGVGPSDKSQQALCLFGTLLIAHSYEGTPSFKTTSAIPTGRQLAASISADVFGRFVLCDSVAEILHCSVSELPTACGDGSRRSGPDDSPCTLSSVEANLEDNRITLSGVFATKLGDIDFRSNVLLTINNGEVISALEGLDVSASGGPSNEEGSREEASLAQFRSLIEAVVAALSRKMAEKLTGYANSGLLWGPPDYLLIVKDQGISFSRKLKVEPVRVRELFAETTG